MRLTGWGDGVGEGVGEGGGGVGLGVGEGVWGGWLAATAARSGHRAHTRWAACRLLGAGIISAC